MKDKIFHIKAINSFDGRIKGRPYRTIAIQGNKSLYKLAEIIIQSFDFYFDHCFGFYDNLKNPFQSNEGYELFQDIGEDSHFPGVNKTNIYKVYNEKKKKLLFYFDYGDGWHFVTQLLKIEDIEQNKKYPIIIDSFGKAPEQYPNYEEDFE